MRTPPHARSHPRPRWLAVMLLCLFGVGASRAAAEAPPEAISQHTLTVEGHAEPAAYLLYEPAAATPRPQRSLLVYLYGAGGSIKNYNLKREPYAALRAALLQRGWYIVVPDLGPRHFMNDAARQTLDAVIDDVRARHDIDASRVHLMGTSMGAGSALAYAIHRPTRVRSVCAVMPMTDFAAWVEQNPKYGPALAAAYGGTPTDNPAAYDANSAVRHADAFADIPVMLIHGTADPVVRFDHSRILADSLAAKGYRCILHPVEGVGHVDDVIRDYQDDAAAFFAAAMEP